MQIVHGLLYDFLMGKRKLEKVITWALWAMFAGVLLFVIKSWYFPISHYFQDDEWFVLPERIWYPEKVAWLQHLMFFSQNRNTWVGDYMLFRPGLFSWIWLHDILFRSARVPQQIFLILTAFSAFVPLFFLLRKEAGKLFAAVACLFAFCCIRGHLLYTWPHINGYILSLTFYSWAALVWSSKDLSAKRAALAGGLFFLAETFHEFVAVTLVLLLLGEFFFGSRNLRATRFRLASLGGALILYGLVVTFGYLAFKPPAIFSPTETDGLVFGWDYIYRVFYVQSNLAIQILDDFIPFPFVATPIDYLRWVFGLGMLARMAYKTICEGNPEDRRKKFLAVAPLIAIFVGLLLGRVATRGGVKSHYFPIFQYFLIMWAVFVFPRMKPKFRAGLTVVLLATCIWTAIQISMHNKVTSEQELAPVISRAVADVEKFLAENKGRCYAGVFDSKLRSRINEAVNIVFFQRNCDFLSVRPAYFSIGPEGEAAEVAGVEELPIWKATPILDTLGSAEYHVDLARYLANLTYNFREAELGLRHSGVLRMRALKSAISPEEIVARFSSTDEFPQLFNVGLFIRSRSAAFYFILRDNVLKVITRDSEGHVQEVAGTQLSSIKKDLKLRVRKAGYGCLVYLDSHLLTQLGECLGESVNVGAFDFENGTPPETLISFDYRL